MNNCHVWCDDQGWHHIKSEIYFSLPLTSTQVYETKLQQINGHSYVSLAAETFMQLAFELEKKVMFTIHNRPVITKTGNTISCSSNWTIADGIRRTADVLDKKAEEYALNADRYWNFRRIKEIAEAYYPYIREYNLPLSFYATILQLKHTVSVLDIECDLHTQNMHVSSLVLDEKFGDETNYNFLIEGLIREENEAARNKHNARATESE